MNVCHDWALRSWILSWGRFARVVEPASLAKEVRADLQAADDQYAS
jgi:predicted DNA-binding transcriptional regulator YafY